MVSLHGWLPGLFRNLRDGLTKHNTLTQSFLPNNKTPYNFLLGFSVRKAFQPEYDFPPALVFLF